MTLPMAARARYNLVSGALIRTMDVWGGVLHMYNLRAGAKSGPRRPRDSQGKKLNTAAAGGGLEDILTLPVTSCALYHVFLGIPSRLRMCQGAFRKDAIFEQARNWSFAHPPTRKQGGSRPRRQEGRAADFLTLPMISRTV